MLGFALQKKDKDYIVVIIYIKNKNMASLVTCFYGWMMAHSKFDLCNDKRRRLYGSKYQIVATNLVDVYTTITINYN